MTLSTVVESALIEHARRAAPEECCGLLLGTADAIVDAHPARNVAADPRRRYVVSPEDHFDAVRVARGRNLEVVGGYHSHPMSPAIPSPRDAAEGFPYFLFIIVGLGAAEPEVTGWKWTDGNFGPVPLVRGF